jgi:hypothetical protein
MSSWWWWWWCGSDEDGKEISEMGHSNTEVGEWVLREVALFFLFNLGNALI